MSSSIHSLLASFTASILEYLLTGTGSFADVTGAILGLGGIISVCVVSVWGIDKFNGECIHRNYSNRKYYVYGIVGINLFDCNFCGISA